MSVRNLALLRGYLAYQAAYVKQSREVSRTGVLETPKHGKGKLKRGGINPNAGRPPDEFKELCRRLASRPKTFEVAEKILDNPDVYPSLYTGALKWATEQGYGKPKEHIEHTGEIKHGVVILPAVQGK